jgi:hypothetical protein
MALWSPAIGLGFPLLPGIVGVLLMARRYRQH